MNLGDFVLVIRESLLFKGTVVTGMLVFIAFCTILVLLGITMLLRQFFKRHPLVDRAHRMLIYLLTMTGVLALFIGGIIGIMLPVIPGVVLIVIGLLVMRRYHRWKWFDAQFAKHRRKLRKTALYKRFHLWRLEHRRRKRVRLQEKLNKLRERPRR
jgi:hypothetical protein